MQANHCDARIDEIQELSATDAHRITQIKRKKSDKNSSKAQRPELCSFAFFCVNQCASVRLPSLFDFPREIVYVWIGGAKRRLRLGCWHGRLELMVPHSENPARENFGAAIHSKAIRFPSTIRLTP